MASLVLLNQIMFKMFQSNPALARFYDSLFTQLATAVATVYQLRMCKLAHKHLSNESNRSKRCLWTLMMTIHCMTIACIVFLAAISTAKPIVHYTENLPTTVIIIAVFLAASVISAALLVMSADWSLIGVSCVLTGFCILHWVLCEMQAFGLTPIFDFSASANCFRLIAFSCMFPFPLYLSNFSEKSSGTNEPEKKIVV